MLEEKLNEDYEEDDDEEYDDDLQSAPIEDYEEEENKEKIESLDSIKKRFEKKGKKDGFINQEDVFDAVAHLDLSDDELDSLIQYFKDKKIQVLSDSNDENLDDIDVSDEEIANSSKDDDLTEVFENDDYDADAMEHIDPNLDSEIDMLSMDSVKINDPVKMYRHLRQMLLHHYL